jgi:2-iminobutanoate/2-iminopropanoate deaminase
MKKIISSNKAPAAIGPYSMAVQAGPFLYSSGQLGIDPQTGSFVEGGIVAETRQALSNLQNVLDAAGLNLTDVIKTTVFLQDMNDFGSMNSVYAEFFTENPPARSAVQVAALPKGGTVEIEAVAVISEN